METIVANVQLTPEDYIKASRLHQKRSTWFGRHILLIGGVWVAVFGLSAVVGIDTGTVFLPVAALIGGILAYLWSWYYVIPARCRKIFRQQRGLQRPYTMEFGDAGMQFRSEGVSSARPWTEFHKWVEGPDLFLLYYSDIMFNMLPKRSVPEPGRLRELFAARITSGR